MNSRLCGAMLGLAVMLGACVPRERLPPLLRIEAAREFPEDFRSPLSSETGLPMAGFGGGGGGVTRTPILFVHGNTESAAFWKPVRAQFLAEGWTRDELWAFSLGWNSVRRFDSSDRSAVSIGRAVDAMTQYLSRRSGREIRQVDIVAHSLGVTAVRQWMKQDNAWHRVRVFVAVAGANHGVWTARSDARGQNRVSAFELAPGSPWLEQLNRGGETPGPTRYVTLYDGTGRGDVLFPPPYEHSPRLEGADNLPFNVERGSYLDHLELARAPQAVATMVDALRAAGEPLPNESAPKIQRAGEYLLAEPGTARLHCATGTEYPSRRTPAKETVLIEPGALTTCFASDARSGLSSAMQRFRSISAPSPSPSPPTIPSLRAHPSAASFEGPQFVELSVNEAGADIFYTTTGAEPEVGSPRYEAPIFIAGPVALRAVAITADGRRLEEIRGRYDISLGVLEARHSLQGQLEPKPAQARAGKP